MSIKAESSIGQKALLDSADLDSLIYVWKAMRKKKHKRQKHLPFGIISAINYIEYFRFYSYTT